MNLENLLFFNVEIYCNYFEIYFSNGMRYAIHNGKPLTDMRRKDIKELLDTNISVGFNSKYYDLVMINALFSYNGSSDDLNRYLYGVNVNLVEDNREILPYPCNHIDIKSSVPKGLSLAACAIRANADKVWDIGLKLRQEITTDSEIKLINEYNETQINHTELVYSFVKGEIDAKLALGEELKLDDCGCKTWQQIAEHYVRGVCGFKHKYVNYKNIPEIEINFKKNPHIIRDFEVKPFIYDGLNKMKRCEIDDIVINGKRFVTGIGGLHYSVIKKALSGCDEFEYHDFDVASYYIALILNQKIHFPRVGDKLEPILRGWLAKRLVYKKTNKLLDKAYKLLILSIFGKMADYNSVFFTPQGFPEVTINGQFMLLELIEALENNGVEVIMANTDGIVIKSRISDATKRDVILDEWSNKFNFKLEGVKYTDLFIRDVNNYFMVCEDGSFKNKGVFAPNELYSSKWNGDMGQVVNDAMRMFLVKGTPILTTLKSETNINKFIFTRKSNKGAIRASDGKLLGKHVRFLFTTKIKDAILTKDEKSLVAGSYGCTVVINSKDIKIKDLDYKCYENLVRSQIASFNLTGEMDMFDTFGD
jgi:hypothetical protein